MNLEGVATGTEGFTFINHLSKLESLKLDMLMADLSSVDFQNLQNLTVSSRTFWFSLFIHFLKDLNMGATISLTPASTSGLRFLSKLQSLVLPTSGIIVFSPLFPAQLFLLLPPPVLPTNQVLDVSN
jgi:hypothetical protein